MLGGGLFPGGLLAFATWVARCASLFHRAMIIRVNENALLQVYSNSG